MPEAMACRFNTTSLSVTNAHELDAKYPPICVTAGAQARIRKASQNEQSGAGYCGRVRLMGTSATEPEVRAMSTTESHWLPAL